MMNRYNNSDTISNLKADLFRVDEEITNQELIIAEATDRLSRLRRVKSALSETKQRLVSILNPEPIKLPSQE